MSSNTDTIVQEIRAQFESILTYAKESKAATADQVECGIFKRLLDLGARLLLLFFCQRAQDYPRVPVPGPTGEWLPYHADKKRDYFSIFGKLAVSRPYFYRPGVGGHSPLDGELSLGSDCYSDLLRELVEFMGIAVPYEKVATMFERFLGQPLSTQAISRVLAEDAAAVESYYSEKVAPVPTSEAVLLVIQADGKGVPMVRETPVADKVRLGKGEKHAKKKEAIVTAAYTMAPQPRTADEVIASYFHCPTASETAKTKRDRPHNKYLRATLDGKDSALERLATHIAGREGPHIQQRLALTDGCEALQLRVQRTFPTFSLVLDFIHADEYLWDVANSLFAESDPRRVAWVEAQAKRLLSGQTAPVVTDLRNWAQQPERTQAQRSVLLKVADYYAHNLDYMHYDQYLAQGWPIASGVIEGACRHFVKDRCELSGMRWTQIGAENLLRLRAVGENDDWEAYHQYRKRQRHAQLYRLPFPSQGAAEDQALHSAGQSTLTQPATPSSPLHLAPASKPVRLHIRLKLVA